MNSTELKPPKPPQIVDFTKSNNSLFERILFGLGIKKEHIKDFDELVRFHEAKEKSYRAILDDEKSESEELTRTDHLEEKITPALKTVDSKTNRLKSDGLKITESKKDELKKSKKRSDNHLDTSSNNRSKRQAVSKDSFTKLVEDINSSNKKQKSSFTKDSDNFFINKNSSFVKDTDITPSPSMDSSFLSDDDSDRRTRKKPSTWASESSEDLLKGDS